MWTPSENVSKDIFENTTSREGHQKTFIQAGLLPDLVILVCIASTGAFGNGVVLCNNLFWKKLTSLQPLEVLVLNSALADFLLCVLYIPSQVGQLYSYC